LRNINDLYNLADYICRKERGVFINPQEFTDAMDWGQMELYQTCFAVYGVNQTIHDALSNFKVRQQFTSAADGTVTFNSDYLHLLGGVFTVTGSTINPVRFLSQDELPQALTAQLRAVSLSSPIAVDNAGGFYLYPQSQQTGFYTYMKRPAIPVLAFTLSGTDGRTVTYNPSGSTQLEFTDIYYNNILSRALKLIGINMDEQGIEAFAQSQSQQSN
jgi:hypothetical protein